MTLSELFSELPFEIKHQGDLSTVITDVSGDSRTIQPGSLFVALRGGKYDGNRFIDEAVRKGAAAVLTDQDLPALTEESIPVIRVDDTSERLRDIVNVFYRNPSKEVRVIGVTGTNGKTTTTYLLESILTGAEKDCGIIGTVNYRIGDKILPAVNTTPSMIDNQRLLRLMADDGVDYCVMEVSSHALDQDRVSLIDFACGVFTNLTNDHLDYHETMQNYFIAKSKLFTMLETDANAVINTDDPYGRKLVSKTNAHVLTYGISNSAKVMATDLQLDVSGTRFKLICPDGETLIQTPLIGKYNVYNILSAASAALAEGISLDKIKKGIERLNAVPGRLERLNWGQDYTVFVDYAHTPDALENVLSMLRATSDSKIIVVFGCGGDRDKSKRPLMGKLACQLADYTIVTTDNPRSEDPQDIINQIVEGFDKDNYRAIVNRKEAIEEALSMAQANDIVLIAGKGHENYQIFKDNTIVFDEKQIIRQAILC